MLKWPGNDFPNVYNIDTCSASFSAEFSLGVWKINWALKQLFNVMNFCSTLIHWGPVIRPSDNESNSLSSQPLWPDKETGWITKPAQNMLEVNIVNYIKSMFSIVRAATRSFSYSVYPSDQIWREGYFLYISNIYVSRIRLCFQWIRFSVYKHVLSLLFFSNKLI